MILLPCCLFNCLLTYIFTISFLLLMNIVKVVHFNCKQTLKNQCGLNLCLRCKNGLSCVRSACGGCYAIGCYNGTMDIEKMYPMMIWKTIITCLKNLFHILQRERSRNSVTSKMELFMTTDKGYILDMARFLGLSLDYVTMLFIGLV